MTGFKTGQQVAAPHSKNSEAIHRIVAYVSCMWLSREVLGETL